MNVKKNICRLCFKFVETEFQVIDAVVKAMLDVLFVQMNLEAIGSPITCDDCMKITNESFYFKSDCIKTEQLILSFAADKNETEFELRQVSQYNRRIHTVTQDHILCRFCMKLMERKKCVSIKVLTAGVNLIEMLTVLIPELDFNIIKNPVTCIPCREKLEGYLELLSNYLKTEQNINESNRIGQPSLEDRPEYIRLTEIKPELDAIGEKGDLCLEEHDKLIKHEKIDIKDEEAEGNSLEKVLRKYNENPYNPPKAKDISEVKMYQCPSCIYKTMYMGNLKSHMVIHRDISTMEVYKCTLCTYETVHKYSLKKHIKIHKDVSEVKLHKCPNCPYETRHNCNMGRHLRIHRDVPETEIYKCTLCTYLTKHKDYLQKHMVSHKDAADVKKYMCALCTYVTSHKDSLKKHTLTHKSLSEVQTFKCTICSFKTARMYSLRAHMQVHKDVSEVQMYKCADCNFETKYKYNLTKHMLKHQDVEMLKCGVCDYKTKRKDCLKYHIMRKHETILDSKT